MKKSIVRKGLVLGIIVLFVGASVVPSIASNFNTYLDEDITFYRNPEKNHEDIGEQPQSSRATTITIQPSSQDSYVNRWDPDQNYGYGDYIEIETGTDLGPYEFSYIKFGLSSIPSGVNIISANLKLYCYYIDVPVNVYAYEASGSWNEHTITWNTGPDWYTSPSSYQSFSSTGWISWDVTDHVNDWYTGVHSNYGFVIIDYTHAVHFARFASKEYSTASWRPKLEVTYSGNDLSIDEIKPIQVIYDVPMVKEKIFAVRAEIQNSFNEEKKVPIKLSYNLGSSWIVDNGPNNQGIPLVEGKTIVFIPGGPYSHDNGETWSDPWERPFPYPVNEGSDTITLEVDPYNNVIESNEDNNNEDHQVFVLDTGQYKIHYYSMYHQGNEPTNYFETYEGNCQFIKGTFPIAELLSNDQGSCGTSTLPGLLGMMIDLQELDTKAWLSNANRAIGIVSNQYFSEHGESSTKGFSSPLIPQGVLVEDEYWALGSHEIGHTYGLVNWPINYENDFHHEEYPPGFWVNRREVIHYTDSVPHNFGYCFMGGQQKHQTGSWYTQGGMPLWVCEDCYSTIFGSLLLPNRLFSEKTILVRGFLYRNDTAIFKNMYVLEDKQVVVPPTETGNYSIQLVDINEQSLYEIYFEGDFRNNSNISGFAFSLPYPENVKKIQMLHNQSIIYEKIVTPSPPSVNLNYPNGNEILWFGENYSIVWNASDLDGDNLTYSLLFSPDMGNNWITLALDINQTIYNWNTTNYPTGENCLIQVIVTDGINTAVDESNDTFSLNLGVAYVDDNYNSSIIGWQNNRFDNIQDGIDAVAVNGTVYVYNGTYYENLVINKSINLIGEESNSVIINGNGSEAVISISGDLVDIANFTIQNGGKGIKIMESSHNKIYNCNILNNSQGIFISHPTSTNNSISTCKIKNNNQGISFDVSTNNELQNCIIKNNNQTGISLSISSNNILSNCSIINNGGSGIYLTQECLNNMITDCIISDNDNYGISFNYLCDNNKLSNNRFFNNTINTYDDSNNTWYNSSNQEGNYYDDYVGTDRNGDGIGDSPHNITGGSNQDLYPLGYFHPIANFTYSVIDLTVQFNGSVSHDPDGYITQYAFDFGDNTSDVGIVLNHTYGGYGTYNVTLTVTDNDGKNDTISKDVTLVDLIPPEISNVQAIPPVQNIGGYVNISAVVTDNVGVNEVYLYIDNPDRTKDRFKVKRTFINITQNKTGDTYYCNTTYQQPRNYTYYIWANDGGFNFNISANYTFEITDQPPYTPSNPSPPDGAINVSINVELNWTGGDPDPGDTVTYDVYFGSMPPIPKVSSNQSSTSYEPGTLNYELTYYWKIVAWDNHGAFAEGPTWSFTTEEAPVPDLDCDGSLSWVDVSPGATVTGNFTVENIGESGSLLDWEINETPDWGIWTFTPSSGDDLLPDEPVTVGVTVIAPNQQNEEFTGEVKIVNKENSSDFCIIDVSLATPVSQPSPQSQYFNIHSFIKKLMV